MAPKRKPKGRSAKHEEATREGGFFVGGLGGPVWFPRPGPNAMSGAVDVHLQPVAIQPLPDPGFTAARGVGSSVMPPLGEPGIAHHHGIVAKPAQMGASHSHLACQRIG